MDRSTRGFTLIELLVVIAIVALLVSILMPSLSAARSQAKTGVCLSNVKRLSVGTMLYINENRDKFPPMRLKKSRPTDPDQQVYVNEWGRSKPRWQWFVDASEVGPVIDPTPFFKEIESTGSFNDDSIGVGGESGRIMTNKYFICPELGDEFEFDVRNGAYGYNYQYLGDSRQVADDHWNNFPVSMSGLKSTGQTVLYADSRGAGRRHGKHSYSLDPPRLAVERNVPSFGPGADDVPEGLDRLLYQYSPVEARHGHRGNAVFVDGHAESMTLIDLGYQLNADGVAMPIGDPMNGVYTATNRLWNGEAFDRIAAKHRP